MTQTSIPITKSKDKPSPFIDRELVSKLTDAEKNLRILGNDLTFADIPEYKRTKHVHRLHPYLGKFIPQLVEVFLKKCFKPGDIILDPLVGSGTTLVETNILGMPSIGIELSRFNCLISKVKIKKYDMSLLEFEIKDILDRVKAFSQQYVANQQSFFERFQTLETDSEYLKTWLSERALQEILYYRSLIPNYKNQDILKIILSRATRSARLIPHYDLARPKKPIRTQYWCIKHKRVCEPIGEALKFINRYSYDTIKRIKEFDQLRTDADIKIIQGDAKEVNLADYGVKKGEIDGIFTSPPYVGMIDYHDQHKYAYELFNFPNHETKEIGSMSAGRSQAAKEEYQRAITAVFKNIASYLKEGAQILIVVNDRDKLYPKIVEDCNFDIIDVFHRPVLMRTERDSTQYFESIYYFTGRLSS